ncbi:MAG TPA: hypothetical protein VIL27_00065, partial [Clostridia bacterium]
MKKPLFRKPIAILLALFLAIPSGLIFFFTDKAFAADPMSAVLMDAFNLRTDHTTSSAVIALL